MNYSISLNTITDKHVTTRTWLLSEEDYKFFEAGMVGEPDAEQIAPFELIDEMLDDGRHVAF